MVAGPAAPGGQVISGSGTARSATFMGGTTVSGSLGFTTLGVGTATAAGQVTVGSGGVLTALEATILYGALTASGAATRLEVGDTLTLGGVRTATATSNPALSATSGAAVRLGALKLLPSTTVVAGASYVTGAGMVSVDATSTIEIGTAGGAATGKITVDPGRIVSGSGTLSAGGRGIVDNGVILASGGLLTLADAVSGYGALQVGAGATLNLTSSAVSTAAIAFVGTGSTLVTSAATTNVSNGATLNAGGLIGGFVLGDVITVFLQKAVTSVVYAAGSGGVPGLLTLKSGASTVGTLLLSGDFTGRVFAVAPNPTSSGAYDVTLQPVSGNAGTPSAGTAAADVYLWSAAVGGGVVGGGWNDAVNWTDASTGASPAGVAPGFRNAVTLAAATSGAAVVVYGPGNAASLTVTGAAALNGTFGTGALSVGTAGAGGALSLLGGGTTTAASARLVYGPLTVTGSGTRLNVSGTLSLGGARTATGFANTVLTVSGGAAAAAAGVTLAASSFGGAVTGGASIVVDATSSLEVGGAGGTAAGSITVDAGAVLSGAGSLSAAGRSWTTGPLWPKAGSWC